MPYYLWYTNGASLTTIPDGEVNTTSTSLLSLIGKNFPLYGQLLNQNLVSICMIISKKAYVLRSL